MQCDGKLKGLQEWSGFRRGGMPTPIYSKPTNVFMVREANRRPLNQSPGHASCGEWREWGWDVSRHQIEDAPLLTQERLYGFMPADHKQKRKRGMSLHSETTDVLTKILTISARDKQQREEWMSSVIRSGTLNSCILETNRLRIYVARNFSSDFDVSSMLQNFLHVPMKYPVK